MFTLLLAEAMRVPSGDQDTDITSERCRRYVRTSEPAKVPGDQICTVVSSLPEAMRVPSGDQDTERTRPV